MSTQILISHRQSGPLAMAVFSASLLIFRVLASGTIFYGFLLWNLFLAAVPFFISNFLLNRPRLQDKKLPLLLLSAIWLLFFPNAPYIITDFLHFKFEDSMPAWFDVLLLTSFSWCGIAFGFISMNEMNSVFARKFGGRMANTIILFCCLLSGYGIFIGRFLRYNSWDILSQPFALICDVIIQFFTLRAIGFSLGYGIFLFLLFCIFKSFINKPIHENTHSFRNEQAGKIR